MNKIMILAMFAILAGAGILATTGSTVLTSVSAVQHLGNMTAGNVTAGNMTSDNATGQISGGR